ncbi:MAG: DUF3365 domain-containing protein [Deltaproteobacteria bacterium]|nr:DUF3365 domain-containing protein [Deltaproteobacteria bacterium]
MRIAGIIAGVVMAATAVTGVWAAGGQEAAEKAAVEIINMRSSLAKTFIQPDIAVTEETFKKVCGAVGRRVKELTETGLVVRHAATRNRNPVNAATPEEEELIRRFEADKGLGSITRGAERDGKKYYSFTKPIYVEQVCLACHGDKNKMPGFITEKYPVDKAYGFKEGDLRGIITVTAPLD